MLNSDVIMSLNSSHATTFFWINTLEKSMNLIISPAMDWIAPLLSFYNDGFSIK